MRVPGKGDAEHVPDFALVPVRGRPEVVMLSSDRDAPVERGLDADVLVALEGEQVIDDGESRGRQLVPVHPHPSSMAVRS